MSQILAQTTDRRVRLVYAALGAVLVFCVGAFMALTRRWLLVGDAPLLHYGVFLMRHGLAPYREIVDLNQPGAYAAEAAVMAVFGKGALAWRVWDWGLLLAISAAMVAICGRGRRFAALWAASAFALIHGRDGLIDTGQRDLLMAALLLPACALLIAVARAGLARERYGLSFSAGLLLGAAASVKPVALVFAAALPLLAGWELRKQRRPWARHGSSIAAGVSVPLVASLLFLLHERALGAFWALMLQLAPYHASLWRLAPGALVGRAISSVLLPVFCLSLPLLLAGRYRRGFEGRVLLLGFLCGVVSFAVQGRGYPYHRYPSEVFLLLEAGILSTEALRARPGQILEACAAAGLLFGALVIAPRSLWEIARFDGSRDPFGDPLRTDLRQMGARDGDVQCLDMAGGCVAALYDMRLLQNSGMLYDCYLYPAKEPEGAQMRERDWYREQFRAALLQGAPRLLVVSSDECGPPDFEYRKLARWPWLAGYLAEQYAPVRDEVPTELERWGGKPVLPYGYRIYRRKNP